MSHPYLEYLRKTAKKKNARVALPDAQLDGRVLEAGCIAHQEGLGQIILTGSRKEFQKLASQHKLDIKGMEVIDPDEIGNFREMCEEYGRIRAKENLTMQQIDALLRDPAYFACMLHRHGRVDGICAGVYYATSDLARAAIKILGMKKGFVKMTAMAVVVFDHTPLGDNLVFCCADGTILPRPTSEELAEIAILTHDGAKHTLPDKPRVAMLSFSTLGSAKHEEVDRVVKALELVKQRRPDICIDGEFQMDTALSPFVASKKVKRPSEVAGRANVLIWPDLQAGNMAGKALMMMGQGKLVGATFLGINGLVGDHSRGATVEEIVAYITYIGAQVEKPGA